MTTDKLHFDTTPTATRYERARAIGERARAISNGDTVHVDAQGLADPLEMATIEYYAQKCPLIARRYFPDGHHDDLAMKDMKQK